MVFIAAIQSKLRWTESHGVTNACKCHSCHILPVRSQKANSASPVGSLDFLACWKSEQRLDSHPAYHSEATSQGATVCPVFLLRINYSHHQSEALKEPYKKEIIFFNFQKPLRFFFPWTQFFTFMNPDSSKVSWPPRTPFVPRVAGGSWHLYFPFEKWLF